jgi:hypothetical protein
MKLTLDGIFILFKELQAPKAPWPIYVKLEGIIISVRFTQDKNDYY